MNATLPLPTHDRVRANTRPAINQKIDAKIEERLSHAENESPEDVRRRLARLEREWDIERYLEVNASSLALVGIALATFNRKWLLLSGTVLGFLFLHGVQGWCPPLPLFRARGVRTRSEIEVERQELQRMLDRLDAHLKKNGAEPAGGVEAKAGGGI